MDDLDDVVYVFVCIWGFFGNDVEGSGFYVDVFLEEFVFEFVVVVLFGGSFFVQEFFSVVVGVFEGFFY